MLKMPENYYLIDTSVHKLTHATLPFPYTSQITITLPKTEFPYSPKSCCCKPDLKPHQLSVY